MTRWYENITIDEAFPLGSHTFTAEEIIRFGKLYDPQYFHVDEAAAKASHFGGLVASGWHTVSVGHRRMVDVVDHIQKRIRLHAMLGHQPAQCRAIFIEELLLVELGLGIVEQYPAASCERGAVIQQQRSPCRKR